MHRTLLVILAAALTSGCQPPRNDSAAERAGAKERDEKIATIINLNGMLCAKVVFVGPEVSPGEVQVNCEEYRDPRKSKTKNNEVVYMVDTNRNSVRLVGRG